MSTFHRNLALSVFALLVAVECTIALKIGLLAAIGALFFLVFLLIACSAISHWVQLERIYRAQRRSDKQIARERD